MPMALYTSNLISTPVITPAKSNTLFLRSPSLILRLRSPTPCSSTLSAKPISQSVFANPLRASPPRQYVYPNPIPEFAEAVSTTAFVTVNACMWIFLVFTRFLCCIVIYVLLQETQKFRAELLRKLLKDKDTFGDELDEVIDVCAEVGTLSLCIPNFQTNIVSGCSLF